MEKQYRSKVVNENTFISERNIFNWISHLGSRSYGIVTEGLCRKLLHNNSIKRKSKISKENCGSRWLTYDKMLFIFGILCSGLTLSFFLIPKNWASLTNIFELKEKYSNVLYVGLKEYSIEYSTYIDRIWTLN